MDIQPYEPLHYQNPVRPIEDESFYRQIQTARLNGDLDEFRAIINSPEFHDSPGFDRDMNLTLVRSCILGEVDVVRALLAVHFEFEEGAVDEIRDLQETYCKLLCLIKMDNSYYARLAITMLDGQKEEFLRILHSDEFRASPDFQHSVNAIILTCWKEKRLEYFQIAMSLNIPFSKLTVYSVTWTLGGNLYASEDYLKPLFTRIAESCGDDPDRKREALLSAFRELSLTSYQPSSSHIFVETLFSFEGDWMSFPKPNAIFLRKIVTELKSNPKHQRAREWLDFADHMHMSFYERDVKAASKKIRDNSILQVIRSLNTVPNPPLSATDLIDRFATFMGEDGACCRIS